MQNTKNIHIRVKSYQNLTLQLTKDAIQLRTVPEIPNIDWRQLMRMLWSTVSKAADKSRRQSSVTSPCSAARRASHADSGQGFGQIQCTVKNSVTVSQLKRNPVRSILLTSRSPLTISCANLFSAMQ